MKQTICEITTRHYVPRNWLATEFCSATFAGEDRLKYADKWHDIEYSEYNKYDPLLAPLSAQLDALKLQESAWMKAHWFKSIFKSSPFRNNVLEAYAEIDATKAKRWQDTYTLEHGLIELLMQEGFEFKSKTEGSSGCPKTSSVFVKTHIDPLT